MSFPTSYIKTEGAQVTRAADRPIRTVGKELNKNEGTLFFKFLSTNSNENTYLLYIIGDAGGSYSDLLGIKRTGQNLRLEVRRNNTSVSDFTAAGVLVTGMNTIAFSYSKNGTSTAVNGVSAGSASLSGLLPTALDKLYVGVHKDGALSINESVQETHYIPRALSTTELEALTA